MKKVMKRVIKISFLLLFLAGCSISVDFTTLDFGSTEITKTFTLTLMGFIEWNIDSDEDWVTVNPDQGQSDQPTQTINVTVDRTGLDSGSYDATLTISTNWNLPCPDILVKMTVEEGPPPPKTGDVEGYVYDEETKNELAGALVWMESVNSDTTDPSGYYKLNDVPFGSHTVNASKEGYEDYSTDIDVDDGIIKHDIYMFPTEIATTTSTTTSISGSTTTSTPGLNTTTTTIITQTKQACCLRDGSCVDEARDMCDGTPMGPRTTCANVSCWPEACCLRDGSCVDEVRDMCDGTPMGPRTTCANVSCGPEACCLRDGSCVDEVRDMCDGTPMGPRTNCANVSCGPEACCLRDGSCVDEVKDMCDGRPMGPGTNCATTKCPQP